MTIRVRYLNQQVNILVRTIERKQCTTISLGLSISAVQALIEQAYIYGDIDDETRNTINATIDSTLRENTPYLSAKQIITFLEEK